MSELAKSWSLLTRVAPHSAARSSSEVLAPSDDFHAKGVAHGGDLRAEATEAQDAQDFAVDAKADGGLPATSAEGGLLFWDVAEHGEDDAPGEFGGGVAQATGAADEDAEVSGGLDIDGGVAGPGGDQQLEVGELLEEGTGEGSALAHGRNDIVALEPAG